MQRFEDLDVWKKAFQLSVEIFKAFKDCRDFGFRDQITRASLSVPSNISEGYERDSNKEFIRFLYIAKGSCGELRTQLCIALEIGYLEKDKCNAFIERAKEISSMLSGLIQKRKSFNL
ncbi:MAG: four helix bundle protein [Deltaproteobacteria bacterium]|nr:four helix bundle protein [Deltaproteobacteria bacterium]